MCLCACPCRQKLLKQPHTIWPKVAAGIARSSLFLTLYITLAFSGGLLLLVGLKLLLGEAPACSSHSTSHRGWAGVTGKGWGGTDKWSTYALGMGRSAPNCAGQACFCAPVSQATQALCLDTSSICNLSCLLPSRLPRLAQAGVCIGFNTAGTSTGMLIASSVWIGGLATLVEKKSRRMELALYCLSRALESGARCEGCALRFVC